MTNAVAHCADLRRPGLLIRAARHGLEAYDRRKHLPKIAGFDALPSPQNALDRLLADEADANQARQDGCATYRVTRHIELLVAIMGEARLLARSATVA